MREARRRSAAFFSSSCFFFLKSYKPQIDSSKMMKSQKCTISHLARTAPAFRVSLNDY